MQRSRYTELLSQLKNSQYENKSQSLCCFNAQLGSEYNNNLMIVGRAVNGWYNEFDLDTLEPDRMVSLLFDNQNKTTCPLKWVLDSWGNTEGYNTKSSAFWRVTRRLSIELNNTALESDWANKIAWSNLYKVAPSTSGNPSDKLCDYQFAGCSNLLLAEIEEYQPKVVVFFTGLNWFNGFLDNSVLTSCSNEFNWVDAYGTMYTKNKEIKIIVAKHPQGKPETEMYNEIMTILSKD